MQNSVLVETYLAHEPELLRFLSKRLGSPSLAADLAHDLYLKVRSTTNLPPVRDARAYLFGMAANLATDHVRVEERRAQLQEKAEGIIWLRSNDLHPERHAIGRAELAYLEKEAAKLDPRCRRVFYLNRYEGKSQAEIAAELGIGLTTVYKDLKMAMAALVAARRRFDGAPSDGHGPSNHASTKKKRAFE